jgi:hypothetical protein
VGDDAIRSMIREPKNENSAKQMAHRKTDLPIKKRTMHGSQSTYRRTNPTTGCAAPSGDHGDQPHLGWCDTEACLVARSKDLATLIPCTRTNRFLAVMQRIIVLSLSDRLYWST